MSVLGFKPIFCQTCSFQGLGKSTRQQAQSCKGLSRSLIASGPLTPDWPKSKGHHKFRSHTCSQRKGRPWKWGEGFVFLNFIGVELTCLLCLFQVNQLQTYIYLNLPKPEISNQIYHSRRTRKLKRERKFLQWFSVCPHVGITCRSVFSLLLKYS